MFESDRRAAQIAVQNALISLNTEINGKEADVLLTALEEEGFRWERPGG